MKLSHLTLAVTASMFVMSTAQAAGLERSTQSVDALFEKGNYAEITHTYVDVDIPAKDVDDNDVSNMIEKYDQTEVAVKFAPTEDSAIALFYNQPWVVGTTYKKNNLLSNEFGQTSAHIKAESISVMGAHRVGDSNFKVYGGIDYQTIGNGDKQGVRVTQPLGVEGAIKGAIAKGIPPAVAVGAFTKVQSGQALNAMEQQIVAGAMTPTMYNMQFEKTGAVVPVIGFAYEKPEIALRAAVTYRSPARYGVKAKEDFFVHTDKSTPIKSIKPSKSLNSTFPVEFPQSVTLAFETGLSAKHQILGKVNARWVDWSKFKVAPPLATQLTGGPLASYKHDQYTLNLGLAKHITPKLAGEINIGYDHGGPKGTELSALGPYGNVASVGIGAQYAFTDALTVGAGGQYMVIDGGEVPGVLTVEDTDGYAVGMKVGYNF